jgi:hypothetical protein
MFIHDPIEYMQMKEKQKPLIYNSLSNKIHRNGTEYETQCNNVIV